MSLQLPTTIPIFFKNKENQKEFEQNGYTIIPFYSANEIDYLTALYQRLHPKHEFGFFPSTFSKDKYYRNTVDDEIKRLAAPHLEQLFTKTKTICGSFIVKQPGNDSEMGVHQDMTLVDETKWPGINVWAPLCDLTEQNGVLYVLPASNRLMPTLRNASIPSIYNDQNTQKAIKQYAVPLYLKAGQAVAFDPSILHFSPPNLSSTPRVVTNIYLTHKDANIITAYWNSDTHGNMVELFEQPADFFTNFEQFGYDITAKPKMGKSVGKITYSFPQLTPQLIHQRYGKKNLLAKILNRVFKNA